MQTLQSNMCNCKRYDPEGERDSGYVCYFCNGRIPVYSLKQECVNGKVYNFCSNDCAYIWFTLE